MDIVLTAILTASVSLLLACGAGILLFRRLRRAFNEYMASWLEAPDETTPSQLAQLADQLAITFAQRMVSSLKSSFLGMQSVAARNEQRLQGDLMMDVAEQANPLIGAALKSFPAVRKRLEKNPELLGLAMEFMNRGNAAAPSNGAGSAPPEPQSHSMSEY